MPAIRTLSGALILAAAMSTTGPAFAAEPMSLADLAARTGNGAFEFRGMGMSAMGRQENVIWSFTPDGKVKGEVLRIGGGWGAGGHYESRKVLGTWRRDGSQLCVQLDPMHARFDGCYGVMTGPGGAVNLAGPVSLEGRLYGGDEPARATTPSGSVGESPARTPRVSPRGMPGR